MTDEPERTRPWWEAAPGEQAAGPQGFHLRRRTVVWIGIALLVLIVAFVAIAALNTAGAI